MDYLDYIILLICINPDYVLSVCHSLSRLTILYKQQARGSQFTTLVSDNEKIATRV